jgi:hypothetical protein
MPQDMTINDLAQLVSQSFTEQQKYMDGRFSQIEDRLNTMDKKFTEHDEKFDRIFTILDNHSHILDRLDQERLFTLEHVKRLENEIDRIKTRLKIA